MRQISYTDDDADYERLKKLATLMKELAAVHAELHKERRASAAYKKALLIALGEVNENT